MIDWTTIYVLSSFTYARTIHKPQSSNPVATQTQCHNNKFHIFITLFSTMIMFCGTDWHYCARKFSYLVWMMEYSTKYYQSHLTLSWIWIMLCYNLMNPTLCYVEYSRCITLINIHVLLFFYSSEDKTFKNVTKGNCSLLDMSISHPSILDLRRAISLYLSHHLKASHFDIFDTTFNIRIISFLKIFDLHANFERFLWDGC